MKKIVFLFLMMLGVSGTTVFASTDPKTISNWETVIYLDNYEIITRVGLDNDNEVAVILRDFSETIGYSVEWIENEQCINLKNANDKISIFVDKYICEKNGKEINLEKPVFIEYDGNAYLPQSFLLDVLDIDIILIDQAAENNRINGLFLANIKDIENDLIIINSNSFSLNVKPSDATNEGETLLFNFSLGIEKELDTISMDYEKFLISNEVKVANLVREELEKTNCHELSNLDNMIELKMNLVNKINTTLDMQFVKYLYVTEFIWSSSLE